MKSYEKNKEAMEQSLFRASEANYRQFLFRNMVIYGQLLIILVLAGYIIYTRFRQQMYVVVDGFPYKAVATNDKRTDAEINAFVHEYMKYLVEINRSNYAKSRNRLSCLSSKKLIEQIKYRDLNSVTIKTVLNTDVVAVKLTSYTLNRIIRSGSIIQVHFTATRSTTMPDTMIVQEIEQHARLVTVERMHENPFGLKMISLIDPGKEQAHD